MNYLVLIVFAFSCIGCVSTPTTCPEPLPAAPPPASSGNAPIESRVTESYRYYMGSAYMHALLTAVHLNDMLLARIDTQDFGDRDRAILSDSLVGLHDMQSQYRKVLATLYQDPAKERRDRRLVPLIDQVTRMTEALERYSRDEKDDDLIEYTRQRERFVNALRNLSQPKQSGG